jgi:hypothetical protein
MIQIVHLVNTLQEFAQHCQVDKFHFSLLHSSSLHLVHLFFFDSYSSIFTWLRPPPILEQLSNISQLGV